MVSDIFGTGAWGDYESLAGFRGRDLKTFLKI